MSRRAYLLEWTGTALFGVAIAMIEPGLIGAFLKRAFDGVASEDTHNLLVAIAGASNELANLISFGWLTAAHGRPRIRFIHGLQVAALALITAIAFIPRDTLGLYAVVALVIAARVCWSGMITLRTGPWRVMYPARMRARAVGHFNVVLQLTIAALGLVVGMLLDVRAGSYRIIFPLACVVGWIGASYYGRIRIRGERKLLANERETPREAGILAPWLGFMELYRVLRGDRRYAQFMLAMFTLGLGNLMLMPALVLVLKDDFHLSYTESIRITTVIPYIAMPLAVPMWARLLDRAHVVKFRSIHSWAFATATAFVLFGTMLHSLAWIYAGSVLWGIGLGGGSLAWHLGHIDFSPPAQTSSYMAAHVTLNGIRGLMAPFFAVWIYNAFKHQPLGVWNIASMRVELNAASVVFGVCTLLCALGGLGFIALRISMGAALNASRRPV